MKPDIYTKAALTVIAVLLTMIVCNQFTNPATTVRAQSPPSFANVEFAVAPNFSYYLFDPRSGEVTVYNDKDGRVLGKTRLQR